MSLHRSINKDSVGIARTSPYFNKLFLDNQKLTVPLDQRSGGLVVFGVHDLIRLQCYQEKLLF